MPQPQHDYVTAAEFSRWMQMESDFRTRIEHRLELNAQEVRSGLGKIEHHLADINGRTRKNSESVAVLERNFDAMKSEGLHIETVVDDIKAHGCAQFAAHETIIQTIGWSGQKKAAIAGGLVGAGALAWPAIQKIAEAVHAAIERWPK